MSRQELKKFNELYELSKRSEDVPLDHPLLKEISD
jgi:hypothetical protein